MNENQRQELRRLAELSSDIIGDNENNVKYRIIIPFLETFGYDKNLDFEHAAQGNRIDIFIDTISGHCILIEAKSYDRNLDDYLPQLKRYCDEKRPILAMICNGEQIRLYSPFWRKPDFSDTLIYSISRHDLLDDHIVSRVEAILSKEFLENNTIIENIEKREKEITDVTKMLDSLSADYQLEISAIESSIHNIENQILSFQSQIDSQKEQVTNKKHEVEHKIEKLKNEHFFFIPQPQETNLTLPTPSRNETGRRQLGRKGYELFDDYLIPIIRLIKSGVSHTEAFHKIAKELDVTYQTANAQCTIRFGNISTADFVNLIKTNKIKSYMKEMFPDRIDEIEKEL